MIRAANRTIAVALAATMAFPTACLSATPAPSHAKQRAPQDLILGAGGVLSGQLTDADGRAIAKGGVWLAAAGVEPVRATTDNHGRFAFRQAPQGVYCLQAGESVRMVRVWNKAAAPPKSVGAVLLVASEAAVRGQSSPPPLLNQLAAGSKRFFAHPVGMLTLGAAIATPIVLAADDDDPPASP